MSRHSLKHLSNQTLVRGLESLVARDCQNTALLIAYLGEVDARHLYAPAGYSSMFEYCVRELHFSEDVAYKRIQVARAARLFPSIYDLLAEGKLHLTAVVLLAPRLTPENADALLAAAVHKSKAQIELLLAERFPQPNLPTFIAPIAAAASPACQTTNAAPANLGLVPEPVKLSDAK